ncbi:hypothetical protein AVEN_266297-1 [Araneus ventricosus]|uniref:MSP domain-containing protein n=1 Tax=Araneus ventricosus TaxID=182803 RepID=A0A4Y2EG58_ARAVE|nr:hypothetical protein AVEN_266297-1 [Araneus ventricosus]
MRDESHEGSSTFLSTVSSRSSSPSDAGTASTLSSSVICSNNLKSSLYFVTLNNCDRQQDRLIAKHWDAAKASENFLVNSFLLCNVNSRMSYGFRVSSKTVKVYPKRGIIESGGEEVLHAIINPKKEIHRTILIKIYISQPLSVCDYYTERKTKNLAWDANSFVPVLLHLSPADETYTQKVKKCTQKVKNCIQNVKNCTQKVKNCTHAVWTYLWQNLLNLKALFLFANAFN